MTRWAEPTAVAQAIEQWSDAVIVCRADGHNWRSLTVDHRPGVYTQFKRCARCRSEKWRDMHDRTGAILSKWHPRYERDYLLRGLGRVDAEGAGLIRLASLRGVNIREVQIEEDS